MLTDVAGVLDQDGDLMHVLTLARARSMIAEGVIHGGMIPKIETCLAALEEGVSAAYVVDGRIAHVILLEVFTEEGVGTELLPGDRKPSE
jgi:acetylglutamate kinase